MFFSAVLAFLAMPGIVAFAIPALWLSSSSTRLTQPLGLLPLSLGTFGLLVCVYDFYTAGKGTLAPWAPPKKLVVTGLYRYSRNPMYVSVALILLGWATAFNSPGLFIYFLGIVVAFHLRIVLGEEPWLEQTHGDEWLRYKQRVRRWV